ncbi:MADS-box protein SOC1 [Abeliophyllum distichum]|uniref:MADS-box protein SOC1 n=1 Tax=Abeliophyllum distichum TaxID=126358 RepID=A0ABD1VX72_9LAMI
MKPITKPFSEEMVRGKVEMKLIENTTSRHLTFSKRRNGLMKKAYELSVLCDSEVALIIFSQKGSLYEFSSSNMENTIKRYLEHAREEQNTNTEVEGRMQHLEEETAFIARKIEHLQNSKRKLLGQNLGTCSMQELQEIDRQLGRSLKIIRARKAQLFNEEMEKLKAKEKFLLEENAKLWEKVSSQFSFFIYFLFVDISGTLRAALALVAIEAFRRGLRLPIEHCYVRGLC